MFVEMWGILWGTKEVTHWGEEICFSFPTISLPNIPTNLYSNILPLKCHIINQGGLKWMKRTIK